MYEQVIEISSDSILRLPLTDYSLKKGKRHKHNDQLTS